MSKVRTRFAPSPTGYMHIGNLRTALYEYLIAKHDGGDFILRIEDTDQEREVAGAVDMIYDVLDKTGLHYDEGPDKPGDVGPYIQSQRLAIYKEYGYYKEGITNIVLKGLDGSKKINQIMDYFRNNDIDLANFLNIKYVDVNEANLSAIEFYKYLGFNEVARTEHDVFGYALLHLMYNGSN